MVRSATGPTRASDGVRTPPVRTTEVRVAAGPASWLSAKRSTTRTELVTMVRPGIPIRRSASAKVVVPAESPIALPGVTNSAAALVTAALAGCSRLDLASNPGSWLLGTPGRTAPPWTFSISPDRARTSRSRRIVMSDTPRRWVRSLTRTLPVRRMSSRIRDCRCLASILEPSSVSWVSMPATQSPGWPELRPNTRCAPL